MNRCRILGALALTCVLIGTAAPVRADGKPFVATGFGYYTGYEPGQQGATFYFNIAGRGRPIGAYTGNGSFFISYTGLVITDGALKLTDTGGNTLNLTFKAKVVGNSNLDGSFQVTGGTGVYLGAAGGGNLSGFLGDASLAIKLDGTISP